MTPDIAASGEGPAENGTPPPPPAAPHPEAVGEEHQRRTRQLFALLRKAGIENTADNKARRLAVYRFIVARDDIGSTDDLHPVELSAIVDTLYKWDKARLLGKNIDEILLPLIEQEETRQQHPDEGQQP